MLRFICTAVAVLGLGTALTATALAQATIEGVVNSPIAPPPPVSPSVAMRYGPGVKIATPDTAVPVVYLEGSFPASTNTIKVEIGQKNLQFMPGMLVVQKGTTVEFPNQDDLYHSVFSYSKVKRFDLGRYLKTEKPAAQTFDQPGVIKLFCEIHEHMRGTILVLDTPHFTKTSTNGTFKLENLPAGKYVLKAWLNEKTTWEQPVELKAGETLKANFPPK